LAGFGSDFQILPGGPVALGNIAEPACGDGPNEMAESRLVWRKPELKGFGGTRKSLGIFFERKLNGGERLGVGSIALRARHRTA